MSIFKTKEIRRLPDSSSLFADRLAAAQQGILRTAPNHCGEPGSFARLRDIAARSEIRRELWRGEAHEVTLDLALQVLPALLVGQPEWRQSRGRIGVAGGGVTVAARRGGAR